ncbi:hypothetical protein JG688_00018603 [Phytophthora aleatoria]|uniref:MULE transposase domain-containing protein n=1 Tax=Phytophthora aleatoria TaxID=2496075 RepID=A0A8J5MBD4_9STRA|nr:hypothetical protein JG688_00018603 [Phytophthora aleatoria]
MRYNVSRKGVEKNDQGQIIVRRFECDRAGKPKNTRKLCAADRLRKIISNAKSASRRNKLASLTSTEALIEDLKKHGFYYAFEADHTSRRLKYLMWAHPTTTQLARHFMDLVVLDCTYKTNRYHLPLLNVIILTGMNKILPLAQVWLPGEAEPDFDWALSKVKEFLEENTVPLPRMVVTDRDLACTNATEVVFPDAGKLLCRWHIERNVNAAAIKKIGLGKDTLAAKVFMAMYRHTVDSESETEFNARRADLLEASSEMAKYLDQEWWPHKEKIVKCWTARYCHFGCHDTSTVEGTHATMKRWLDNSKGDLLNVFERRLPWWMENASRISLQAAKEATFIPTLFREKPQYEDVVRIISVYVLEQTEILWAQALNIVVNGLDRSTCSGTYRRIHGRPSLHDLMSLIDSDGQLKLEARHFDKHWWLPPPQSGETSELLPTTLPTRLLEPQTLRRGQRKRRPSSQSLSHHGINRTRRELSGFELVEQKAAASTMANHQVQSFRIY